jgi:hypothetical protein
MQKKKVLACSKIAFFSALLKIKKSLDLVQGLFYNFLMNWILLRKDLEKVHRRRFGSGDNQSGLSTFGAFDNLVTISLQIISTLV